MSAHPGWVLGAWEGAAGADAAALLASLTGVSLEAAAAVDVGSRDGALIEALRDLRGGVVRTVLSCVGCGETLQVPVDLGALPVSPWRAPGAWFSVEVSGRPVVFRLPTSADLQALHGSVADARRALLSLCAPDLAAPVAGSAASAATRAAEAPDPAAATAETATAEGVKAMVDTAMAEGVAADGAKAAAEGATAEGAEASADAEVADAVERAMEAVAESSALTVVARCGECGAHTEAVIDVAVLLWAELRVAALRLLEDVHVLAAAYGWTEPEIFALSPARRAAYLELIG
ncbi:hypothetical protein [Cryptosporangium sp. NPDC048952]|uniref:hypothetical protein n=1 Tax=Cryptosporangium sp. NPDC048952 TaxID=3363961 RepID=UPI00371A3D2D